MAKFEIHYTEQFAHVFEAGSKEEALEMFHNGDWPEGKPRFIEGSTEMVGEVEEA